MHNHSKGYLERRKKKRERNRPIRQAWRMYFRHIIKQYNGGGYGNMSYPPQSGGQSAGNWRIHHALRYGV